MNHRDLRHFIRTYDADLDAVFCQKLIAAFAQLPQFHATNGRGVRDGLDHSAWTELNVSKLSDPSFMKMFQARIAQALERYNNDVGLAVPVPHSELLDNLVMKRYRPGTKERFQVHFDAIYQYSSRYLVFLWYLNDVAEGGETHFPQLDVTITARTGRLLVFPPYWMYQHEGKSPVSGDKYILSTYLLFSPRSLAPQAPNPQVE
jgi:prolyl 4-hydroxylase